MKEQMEKDQKIKIMVMSISLVIIMGLSISLFFGNKNTDKPKSNNSSSTTSSTTTKKDDNNYVDATSIDIPKYENNRKVYLTSGFTIYENNLYADIVDNNDYLKEFKDKTIDINNGKGYLIQKNITKIFVTTKGKGKYYYLLAINDKGELYYINNLVESKSKKFEVTKISKLKNIKDVYTREIMPMEAVAVNDKNQEFSLNDIIDKYSKFKEEA